MKTRSTFSEGETPTIFIKRTSTKTDAGERETPLNETGLWAVRALLERARLLGATESKHYLLPRDHSKETQSSKPTQLGFDPNQHQVTVRTAWRSLTAKAGLKGLRFHDLRHTANTKLGAKGVPTSTAKSIGGWSDDRMVDYYNHTQMEAKAEAMGALEVPFILKLLSNNPRRRTA